MDKSLFDTETPMFEYEVVEFYVNLAVVEGNVATLKMCGVDITFNK